jgi:hypothetical protein
MCTLVPVPLGPIADVVEQLRADIRAAQSALVTVVGEGSAARGTRLQGILSPEYLTKALLDGTLDTSIAEAVRKSAVMTAEERRVARVASSTKSRAAAREREAAKLTLEAERVAAEKITRLAAEEAAAIEAEKIAEAAAEVERLAVERASKEEAERRLAAERAAEARRLAEIEAKRLAAEEAYRTRDKWGETRVDTSDMPLSKGAAWNDLNDPKAREYLLGRARRTGEGIDTLIRPEALDKLHRLAHDPAMKLGHTETIYFGLAGEKFKTMKPGEVFTTLGTRSTTNDIDRAKSYAGTDGKVFTVDLPPGTTAIPATVFGIDEIMLLPGAKFEVVEEVEGVLHLRFLKTKILSDGVDYVDDLVDFRAKIEAAKIEGEADAIKKAAAEAAAKAEAERVAKEAAEAKRLAEEVALKKAIEESRLRREARLAAEAVMIKAAAEAAAKAAEAAAKLATEEAAKKEALRIKRLEASKKSRAKAKAAKTAAVTAAAPAAPVAPATSGGFAGATTHSVRSELMDAEAEMGRLELKVSSGVKLSKFEEDLYDDLPATIGSLKAELKKLTAADARAAKAKPVAPVHLPPAKVLLPADEIKAEIDVIDAEVERIRKKRTRGEVDTADEAAFMKTRRKDKLEPLWASYKASVEEDKAIASWTPPPAGTPVPVGKAHRAVLSLESEIASIDAEVGRLERKMRRGEKLTPSEATFYGMRDARLGDLRVELRASQDEDKRIGATLKPAAKRKATAIVKPPEILAAEDRVAVIRKELTDLRADYDAGRSSRLFTPEWNDLTAEIAKLNTKIADWGIANPTEAPRGKLKYRPTQNKIDGMVSRVEDDLQRRGVDPPKALSALKELIDKSPVCINADYKIVGYMQAGEERFKTQFETKTSNGSLNATLRARAEHKGLGIPLNVAPAERPVYGYMDIPGNAASHYGGLKFTVKDEVRERMTFTMGDSLFPLDTDAVLGTPMTNPGYEGIGTGWTQQNLVTYANSGRTSSDKQDFMHGVGYIEWQVQGGLPLSDIKAVHDQGRVLSKDNIKWFEARGITVTFGTYR